MAVLKPFKGLRPPVELASKVASRPYDVLNSEEAREEAKGNPYTLLHIIKPEIDFPAGTDEHTEPVYQKAAENLDIWRNNSWLVKDAKDSLYIYAQTMEGRTQYGIVGCASVDDYLKGVIKKHELTRADKEEDRMKHVRITNANMEPVFFAYPAVKELDDIVADIVAIQSPVYDFVAEDGFGHHFWLVDNDQTIEKIVKLFAKIPATYVADGHHRTAAAALVGKEKRAENPNHTGDEEYNYFLAVHFPDNQLKIIDYNRTVKDLNGLSATALIDKIGEDFEIQKIGTEIYKPDQLHTFSMYLKGEWYKLVTKTGCYNDNDPIGVLDVTILSNLILDNILGIKDLRTDKRIDFIGGIRGLGELKERVDAGEMKVAFALYPVSMEQLINIADSGNIMPPKTTWFEPKLRSGLVVHELE
ncbi:MAG: DUF1015 domain-containing protein [Mariniphaga sp.]|nr:DUF1015 domain-containing protein [Mariniphaga sp.]